MKICSKCKENKEISEFPKNGLDELSNQKYKGVCKTCINSDWAYCLMKNISSRESRRCRVRDKGMNIRYARSLLKKQKGKCYWLGIELDVVNKCKLRKPSLDRIDNSKGYEVGNVVLSTVFANTARRDATVDEMKDFITKYLKK